MIDLKGKFAIVSGGGRDIGRAVVGELARCGADVAFTSNSTAPDQTLAEAKKFGQKVIGRRVDALSSSAVNDFVLSAVREAGRKIDILVNVVGGLVARKKIEEMDEAFFDHVIALNLKTTFLMTKAALPHLADGGAIVNFSSQAARDGGGGGAIAYAASKGAIVTFTRGLAKELSPRKIRVNAVCPGMIATTFHDTFTKPEVRQKVAGMTPLGREGQAKEVADLVAYLGSDSSSFVNGAAIDINGGLLFS